MNHQPAVSFKCYRVKSGIVGQPTKFGQPHCFFHILIIGLKIIYLSENSKNPDEMAR